MTKDMIPNRDEGKEQKHIVHRCPWTNISCVNFGHLHFLRKLICIFLLCQLPTYSFFLLPLFLPPPSPSLLSVEYPA